MAVTNYYTVNGRIRGESTGGVRTTYGVDALGSVTGTYDQNGNPQNTYLWAPYGTLIKKTGSASDPKFGWNGSSGYRSTSRNYSGFYVRARHYDFSTGQWSTIDAMWPQQLSYAYVRSPLSYAVGSGLDPKPIPCQTGSTGSVPSGVNCSQAVVSSGLVSPALTNCNFLAGEPYTCICVSGCLVPYVQAGATVVRNAIASCCSATSSDCFDVAFGINAVLDCVETYDAWINLNENNIACAFCDASILAAHNFIVSNCLANHNNACCQPTVDYLADLDCSCYGQNCAATHGIQLYNCPGQNLTDCPFPVKKRNPNP